MRFIYNFHTDLIGLSTFKTIQRNVFSEFTKIMTSNFRRKELYFIEGMEYNIIIIEHGGFIFTVLFYICHFLIK